MRKKYIFLLKSILVLLLVFLISSCDNRTEIEVIPTCNYIFTATTIENATINIAQDINIFIAKANTYTCGIAYTMSYAVSYNGTISDKGLFIYDGVNKAHNTPFAITPSNFIGKFNALQVGAYNITFTVKNTGAENPIQTKTVQVIFSD